MQIDWLCLYFFSGMRSCAIVPLLVRCWTALLVILGNDFVCVSVGKIVVLSRQADEFGNMHSSDRIPG